MTSKEIKRMNKNTAMLIRLSIKAEKICRRNKP